MCVFSLSVRKAYTLAPCGQLFRVPRLCLFSACHDKISLNYCSNEQQITVTAFELITWVHTSERQRASVRGAQGP